MNRADRVERLLVKMRRDREKALSKLRGSGAPAIRAGFEADGRHTETIFLVALAAVSDADLWQLEVEAGLSRGDGVPSPPKAKRATKRKAEPAACPQCHRDLHSGSCEL